MKLFRLFRSEALYSKRVTRYLLYALGEIILVVIGILIAVSINNYNETKKSTRQLQSMLRTYQQDLKTDTTVVGANLRLLKDRAKLFKLFLSDTVSAQDYAENPLGYGLVMSYSPFEFQTKGVQLLQNYADTQNEAPDSLVVQILATHTGYKKLIEQTQQRISDDISDNILYLKNNQPWVADLFLGRLDNPEIMTYYLSNAYRSRLAIHNILVIGNLQRMLEQYQVDAADILEQLSKRLEPQ